MHILYHLDPCACIYTTAAWGYQPGWANGRGVAMASSHAGLCIYEEELRDLLTYDCMITGRKRCPPCSSDNLKENKSIKILNCNGKMR